MLGSRFENFDFCTDCIFHNPSKISSWTCALAKKHSVAIRARQKQLEIISSQL